MKREKGIGWWLRVRESGWYHVEEGRVFFLITKERIKRGISGEPLNQGGPNDNVILD